MRVAYVDNDPIVKAHADALLSRSGATSIVLADLRDPRAVIDHPDVRRVIDFDQPVALLLVAILHFITDAEKPIRSSLAFATRCRPAASSRSHATGDFADRSEAQAVYNNATATFEPADPRRGGAVLRRLRTGRALAWPRSRSGARTPRRRHDPARSASTAWLARSAEPASPAEEAAEAPVRAGHNTGQAD